MEIAQEVAQPPPRRGEKNDTGRSESIRFLFLFCSYVLLLCAIHMCFIMCKKLCANELIMIKIDYEPN